MSIDESIVRGLILVLKLNKLRILPKNPAACQFIKNQKFKLPRNSRFLNLKITMKQEFHQQIRKGVHI